MGFLIKMLADNRRNPQSKVASRIEASNEDDETTIFIYEPIVQSDEEAAWYGGVSAQTLVPELLAMKTKKCHVRINSPGGDVFAAQSMMQGFREYKGHLKMTVDGVAASAATNITTVADEVLMAEGGMFMIHCGWTFGYGNAMELEKTVALLKKIDDAIAGAYAKRSGKPDADLLTLMQAETWFSAQEAVDFGLVTAIAPTRAVSARWDLSAYNNAPKAQLQTADVSAELAEADQHLRRRLRALTLIQP